VKDLPDEILQLWPIDRLRNWVAAQGERWFTAEDAQLAIGNVSETQTAKKALQRMAGKCEVETNGRLFRGRALPEVTVKVMDDGSIERTVSRRTVDGDGRLLIGKWANRTLDEVANETDCGYLHWLIDARVGSTAERKLVKAAIGRWKNANGNKTRPSVVHKLTVVHGSRKVV